MMGLDEVDETSDMGGGKLLEMTLLVFTNPLLNMESLFDVIKLSNLNPDTRGVDKDVRVKLKRNKLLKKYHVNFPSI